MRETEVDNVEEAHVLKRIEELPGELFFAARLVELGKVKRYKIGPVNYIY